VAGEGFVKGRILRADGVLGRSNRICREATLHLGRNKWDVLLLHFV